MKKVMMLIGLVVALSGMVGAAAPVSTGINAEDVTTTGYCDPIIRLLGGCRSANPLPSNY